MDAKTEPQITLSLPLEVVNLLLSTLQELPHKVSRVPIDLIGSQAKAQVDVLNAPKEPEPEE